MIRDNHLKKYVYRAKKHSDRGEIKELLNGIKEKTVLTMDCSARTSNVGSLDGVIRFAEISSPSRVKLDASSRVTGSLNLSKAEGKKIATMYDVLLGLNKRCRGEVVFRLDFSNLLKAGDAHVTLKSDEERLILRCVSNCRTDSVLADRVKSLQGAVALFETILKTPGKFGENLKQISSSPSADFAFSDAQALPITALEEVIMHLISVRPPAPYKHNIAKIFLTKPESWTVEDFNRNIRLVNDSIDCFQHVSLTYAWSPARWEEYEVLEDYYGLFGPADTDACLFEFTLPSGKAGITAMTYGKKGYRLYVSFDDATAIKEFEKLTGVKCEVFGGRLASCHEPLEFPVR